MSSIESVGSSLLQYLQQLRGSDSSVQGTGNKPPPESGDVPEPLWEDVEESAETAGLSADEIEELRSELKTAISEAMANLDMSQTGSDGRAAIDEAVLSTLEEHGIGTDSIREKMAEGANRPPGPPPGGQAQGQGYASQSGQSQSIGDLLSSLVSSNSSTDTDETSQLLSLLSPLVDETA